MKFIGHLVMMANDKIQLIDVSGTFVLFLVDFHSMCAAKGRVLGVQKPTLSANE